MSPELCRKLLRQRFLSCLLQRPESPRYAWGVPSAYWGTPFLDVVAGQLLRTEYDLFLYFRVVEAQVRQFLQYEDRDCRLAALCYQKAVPLGLLLTYDSERGVSSVRLRVKLLSRDDTADHFEIGWEYDKDGRFGGVQLPDLMDWSDTIDVHYRLGPA